MRRFITLAPLALLSTACAARGYTASSALEHTGDVAETRLVATPAEADAIAAWQLPAESPWSHYEKLTLLAYLGERSDAVMLPDVDRLELVRRAEIAAARLGQAGLPPDTMWIIDLRGAASVAFGAELSRALPGKVAPVITFNNWPAENEVVPAEETLSALISKRPALPSPTDTAAAPVFLLDAWRLAFREESIEDDVTDNRYLLSESDLPAVAQLRDQRIRRVIYVVEDRNYVANEEDDLHDLAADYQDAGIGFSVVDLSWFDQIGAAPDWDTSIGYYRVAIGPRFTIYDSPLFFTRSHGGFGGAHPVYTPGGVGPRSYASPHLGGGGGRTFASPHVGGSHSGGGGHSFGGSHGGGG
jgi:hypothetical protein